MPAIRWPLGLLAAVTDRGPPLRRLIRDIQTSWRPYSWVLALKGYAKSLTYKMAERMATPLPHQC